MVDRDLNPDKIEKKKKEVPVQEGADCIDKMLTHKNKKRESDPKNFKTGVNTGYHFELIAHNAASFDNWVVLQELNTVSYVKTDATIDRYREKQLLEHQEFYKAVKCLFDFLVKFLNELLLRVATVFSGGKDIDIDEMFELQDGLLTDSMDHGLITKNTWKSYVCGILI